MVGSFMSDAVLRQELWGVDGTALVVAAALLTVKYLRSGQDLLAAGFLVYGAGQTLILSDAPAGLAAGVPTFGSGLALWSAGLVIVSLPGSFPWWSRAAAAVAAVVFLATAAQIFAGAQMLPTGAPLPSLGYPFMILAFVGWIWRLLRPTPAKAA
jgi:hypothetical protein